MTHKSKHKSKHKSHRKSVSWKGWSKLEPSTHQRTVMRRKCGRKCFLGPDKSFPICAKNTCTVNRKGLHAAYIRARQWGKSPSSYHGKTRPTMSQSVYRKIARSAKRKLGRRKKSYRMNRRKSRRKSRTTSRKSRNKTRKSRRKSRKKRRKSRRKSRKKRRKSRR